MKDPQHHIGETELLHFIDGELTAARSSEIREHLETCLSCRSNSYQLHRAIDGVIAGHSELDTQIPPHEGPRALLRARLAEASAKPAAKPRPSKLALTVIAAGLAVTAAIGWLSKPSNDFAPNASRTPGATQQIALEAVCKAPEAPRTVSAPLAEQVFRNYGIRDPRPRSYEVDYLIPPSLGGAEDPRNLWPQPYSNGVWNSRVKDALEDRLRALVCGGKLDLATAQSDLAHDWIAAYKKYFRTAEPLVEHAAFVKDRPWE